MTISLLKKKVHLMPDEIKNVTFTPTGYSQLNIKDPHIWWPWQYGKAELNRIELSVLHDKAHRK